MTHPNTADPSNAHPPASSESLGVSLGPALREQCGGRLGPIEWFRNGWQHSGAATGFYVWNDGSGSSLDVMVKIPVGPTELEWTSRLAGFALGSASPPEAGSAAPASTDGHEPPTPLVLAAGSSVGNYDLAWLVMERLSGQTLAHEQDPSAVQDLIVAAADFHECAGEQCPIGQTPPPHEWERLIEKARHT
ncbi:MAG TPA: phosphotransferase, partial [Phycisphaerales bacterium]|nr:phosphotransferase [Phycisphaerales bacterium]